MLDAGPVAAASGSSRCQAASEHIRGRTLQTTPTKSVIVCKTSRFQFQQARGAWDTAAGRKMMDGWMRMS